MAAPKETNFLISQEEINIIIAYASRAVLAIIVLIIGIRLIKIFSKILRKQLERREVDETLIPFLSNLIAWVLKFTLFISVAAMVGVETTSLVALLGTAGLAVGLALQGALSNFAGGILIIILRPYRVDDMVEVMGNFGMVEEIQIFHTVIYTPDSKKLIIPNGSIAGDKIINYTALGKIRLDCAIGISYDSDIKQARNIIIEEVSKNPRVFKDPAPLVWVNELADSSVNLFVRVWCKPDDYLNMNFEVLEAAKKALDANGITIPFPQMDVHLDNLNQ